MNQEALNNSVVIVGPVGVGKSLISSKLGEKMNLPVITTDLLRHCPMSTREIDGYQQDLLFRIRDVEKSLENEEDEYQKNELQAKLRHLQNESWVCDRQREMRQILPDVPNYEEMGFEGNVSHYVEDFGKVAWHFYQKQFENQLLKSIVDNLDTPAIIDMGGGMAISLDDEYIKIADEFKKINPLLYGKYMNIENVGFHHIEKALSNCPNVVSLQLPLNYKDSMQRAGSDELNEKFVATGQYDKIATFQIATEGLIEGNSYNPNKLDEIVNGIEKECGIVKM